MTLASSFTKTNPLVLVGAGKMGGAMLKGWLDNGLDRKAVVVIDPAPPPDSAAFLAKAGVRELPEAPKEVTAKVIVVAVKPQIIGDILPGLRPLVGRGTVVLSIAAGTTLANLAKGLGDAAIVRSIPNTPAQVGRGITAAIANDKVGKSGRALITRLLEAVGEVIWVDDEVAHRLRDGRVRLRAGLRFPACRVPGRGRHRRWPRTGGRGEARPRHRDRGG